MKKVALKKPFQQFESIVDRKAGITIEDIRAIPRFSQCTKEELLHMLAIIRQVSKVALLCMEATKQ